MEGCKGRKSIRTPKRTSGVIAETTTPEGNS